MRIRVLIQIVVTCFLFESLPGVSLQASPLATAEAAAFVPLPSSSDSLEFAGLAAALGTIFSQEKIATILSNLPPKCKIFGYDIGEYSGDDGMDVVLSAMPAGGARKTLDVYFFLNEGAGFRLLRTLTRRYILEPIEVGFSIDRGVCYVTEKTGEFSWRITGYSATEGNFRRVSEWTTHRMRTGGRETNVGYERSYSYETLIADEHYYGSNSHRSFIRQKYYDLPVYPEDLSLPDGMGFLVGDSSGLMISSGGSSWYGPDDCSLFCSARYDSSSVVFRIRIHDDRLLYSADADSADHLDLHFDLSRKNRIRPDGSPQTYSPGTQFGIRILMGDGEKRTPVVELLGEAIARRIGTGVAVSSLPVAGEFHTYTFTVRVPLDLFKTGSKLPPAGFVCAYHDVDHSSMRQWVTTAATAREYVEGKPGTYGMLHFVEDPAAEYEWENLRVIALSEELQRAGIIP